MPTEGLGVPSGGHSLVGDAHGDAPQPITPSAKPADWLKIGFYFALGVVLLLVAALAVRSLLTATLAVITPFILGLAFALLLDPLVHKIEAWTKMPRGAAAGLVFLILLLVVVGALSLLIPALVTQATNLIQHGPSYIATLQGHVNAFLLKHHKYNAAVPKSMTALMGSFSGKVGSFLQDSSGKIIGFLIGSATMLVELVLSLIVTLFLLIDLKRLRARLMFLMPERWRRPAKLMSSDVGGVFSDYVRGLLIVCALYGVFTIVLLYGLSLFHHSLASYALLVGTIAGVLYSVPYVGSFSTSLLIFVIGFISGGPLFGVIAVGSSLVLNQVFDNIVTPKVVGGGVGLHPVVALFALVLGGELMGIWGMLLSVPIAASVQVILFRLFPKTTASTPQRLLTAEGVPPDQAESTKVTEGEDSVGNKRKDAQKASAASHA